MPVTLTVRFGLRGVPGTVRGIYGINPGIAITYITRLGHDLQDDNCPPGFQLGRPIGPWRDQISAWRNARVPSGPIEAANGLVKRVTGWPSGSHPRKPPDAVTPQRRPPPTGPV